MTFYFYDLETSGINARAQRIMQFAGQRTDANFNPVGEPQNWLVKITEEILPDPEAILITGITPQKTLEEGYTEAEFLKLFHNEVLQPDTIIVGFNSIRFDDEFMRATLWRNFYDPYEWQWQDGRSRWDLLDVVRFVRALRPEGIEWPVDEKGLPTNRLELLTKANKIEHSSAHDALSDVNATISVAKLLKEKQPKIFDYLLGIRDKKKLAQIIQIDEPRPLLYCSGRYSNNWQKTTAVLPFAPGPQGSVLVYDLRQDPLQLVDLSDDELILTAFGRDEATEILPVKTVKLNACPALAPLGVLDDASQTRLELSLEKIQKNYKAFLAAEGLAERLSQLYEKQLELRKSRYKNETDADFQIYESFVGSQDKSKMSTVRAASKDELADFNPEFSDQRLEALLPRYKARNSAKSLNETERELWEKYRTTRLIDGRQGQLSVLDFMNRIDTLKTENSNDTNKIYLLEELLLYAQSIMPVSEEL